MHGTFTDPGADTFHVTVDWGDDTTTGPVYLGTRRNFQLTHTYLDDDPTDTPSDGYAIRATVKDDDGGEDYDAIGLSVKNVVPVVATAAPTTPIVENGRAIVEAGAGGTPFTAEGTFADAGVADTFDEASTVAYGDFVVGPVTISGFINGFGTFDVPAHRYLAPGDYTAKVTIEDDDTGESDETPASKIPVTAVRLDALTVADAANAANWVWSAGVGDGTYLHLGRKEAGVNRISLSADISAGDWPDLAAKHVRWRVRNGGLTLASGTFDAAAGADRLVTLPPGVGEFVVEAGFDDDASQSLGSGEVSRTVKVRIVTADLDVTNDGDLDDPEDGADEFSPGYRGDAQVLTASDDQPLKVVAENFAAGTIVGFQLADVSTRKGMAGNAGGGLLPDVEFEASTAPADWGGRAIMNAKNKDFGSAAKIRIKIGSVVLLDFDLAKDDDNDGLPNWWENGHGGNLTAASDDDKNKGGADGEVVGDKLPAFDEFRGFMEMRDGAARHVRTSPTVKDVFLKDVLAPAYATTDNAGDTLAWTSNLDLNTHRIGDGQHDAQRKINANGANSQRAVFVENAALGSYGSTSPGPSTTPSAYQSVEVDVAMHRRTVTVLKTLPAAGGKKHVLYTGDSEQDPLDLWEDGGKVGLGADELSYATGYGATLKGVGLKTATVDVEATTTALIPGGLVNVDGPFIGMVGDELIKFDKKIGGGSGTIKELHANGELELKDFADITPPASGYILAKVTHGGTSEWISYSAARVDAGSSNAFLTIHQRGLFGTNELAIADGDGLTIPAQYYDVERGALGTQAAAIPANTDIDAVGALTDVEVGAVNVQPGSALRYFANVDDAVRNVAAHEAGHAVGLAHFGNLLMQNGKKRGSYLHHGFEDRYDQHQMDGDLDAR